MKLNFLLYRSLILQSMILYAISVSILNQIWQQQQKQIWKHNSNANCHDCRKQWLRIFCGKSFRIITSWVLFHFIYSSIFPANKQANKWTSTKVTNWASTLDHLGQSESKWMSMRTRANEKEIYTHNEILLLFFFVNETFVRLMNNKFDQM